MNGFVIFSDLKGFSKLTEPEIRLFYKELIPQLSDAISKYKPIAKVLNTWGDAIVAVFEDGKDAVDFTLDYRKFFVGFNFQEIGIGVLMPRVAVHFGEFDLFYDPILESSNILGTNINTTARIEPVTRAGEIYVTKPFKEAIERLPQKINYIRFDDLGIIPLAKSFGEMEIYRLSNNAEKEQIVDRILKTDLSSVLPNPPQMADSEKDIINYYAKTPTKERFLITLKDENIDEKSGEFILEISILCKKYGLYKEALEFIEKTENWALAVNGINVYPYRHNKKLLKLKADCLTRINKYEQAADIVYGLWQLGMKDSDTLSMLAAQYKRRAIYDGEKFSKENLNIELLSRAKELYLEAFRINISDYYPAINVAYLYKMFGGLELGKGTKLATYILNAWGDRTGEDWWLDSTLAEAELLQDDYELALNRFSQAIEKHSPNHFERKAVAEQIYIYSVLTDNRSEMLQNIIELLEKE
jgi:class 3 adenylate cyclase